MSEHTMVSFDLLFSDETKRGAKIKTSDYSQNGLHPIIDQSQSMVAGYTNLEDGLFNDVPAIIFGDHTRIIKYIDKPFFLGADGTKILKGKDKQANHKYLYYALRSQKIPNLGYSRHFKCLKKLSFKEHNLDEQQRIVEQLDSLSEIISTNEKKLKLYNDLIKARFVEMFGSVIINDKGWETSPISKVAPTKSPKVQGNDKIWLLNLDMVETQSGRVIDKVFVSKNSINASTCAFNNSNVLYSKLRPYLNKVVLPDQEGYCTTELIPLKPNERLTREFFATLLRSDEFVSFINKKTAGAKMPRVSMDVFRSFECILPPIEIQQDFTNFYNLVEKSKAIIQKTIEEIQLLFDSLMQEYFG